MAIKDKWDRIFRKSVSSSSSGGGTTEPGPTSSPDDGTTPVTPATGPELAKAPSRLAKTLTWRSNKTTDSDGAGKKDERKKKQKAGSAPRKLHPSERPLTETNLRHQELLSTFTMNFGRRKHSSGGRTSYSGISPGNSRPGSMDASAGGHGLGHHGHRHAKERRISSLEGEEAPREEPGEEDRET